MHAFLKCITWSTFWVQLVQDSLIRYRRVCLASVVSAPFNVATYSPGAAVCSRNSFNLKQHVRTQARWLFALRHFRKQSGTQVWSVVNFCHSIDKFLIIAASWSCILIRLLNILNAIAFCTKSAISHADGNNYPSSPRSSVCMSAEEDQYTTQKLLFSYYHHTNLRYQVDEPIPNQTDKQHHTSQLTLYAQRSWKYSSRS